ncbi:MAG: hypothetical protein MZU95_03275 [Desulfomicrobium escambiense]|nr:hypothetical protein [Desulfomicrobium escambiense]
MSHNSVNRPDPGGRAGPAGLRRVLVRAGLRLPQRDRLPERNPRRARAQPPHRRRGLRRPGRGGRGTTRPRGGPAAGVA